MKNKKMNGLAMILAASLAMTPISNGLYAKDVSQAITQDRTEGQLDDLYNEKIDCPRSQMFMYQNYIPTYIVEKALMQENYSISGDDIRPFFTLYSYQNDYNRELRPDDDYKVRFLNDPTGSAHSKLFLQGNTSHGVFPNGLGSEFTHPLYTGYDLVIYTPENLPESVISDEPETDDFSEILKNINLTVPMRGAQYDPNRTIGPGEDTFELIPDVNNNKMNIICKANGLYTFKDINDVRKGTKVVASDIPITKNTIPVKMTLNKTSLEFTEGDKDAKAQLNVSITPADSDYTDITWESSDENVAYVDDDGNVVAGKAGEAVITATLPYTSYMHGIYTEKKITVSCTVKVNPKPEQPKEDQKETESTAEQPSEENPEETPTEEQSTEEIPTEETPADEQPPEEAPKQETIKINDIRLDNHEMKLYMDYNSTRYGRLDYKLFPEDADEKYEISYNSDNDNIASVDKSGKVTGNSQGETTITVTCNTESGSVFKDTCRVIVNETADEYIPVESITLDSTSLEMTMDDMYVLSATVMPENASDRENIIWNTDNDSICTVNNGIITTLNPGTTTVTAECGGITTSCQVNVIEQAKPDPSNTLSDNTPADDTSGDSKKNDSSDEKEEDKPSWTVPDAPSEDKPQDNSENSSKQESEHEEHSQQSDQNNKKDQAEKSQSQNERSHTVSDGIVTGYFVAYEKTDVLKYMGLDSAAGLRFTSSDKKIAKSNKKGIVSFKKNPGTVTITAINKSTKETVSSVELTVKKPVFKNKAVTLASDKISTSMNMTEFFDDDGTNINPVWISSDPGVVTIKDGIMTINGTGSVKIYAVFGATSISDKNGTRKKYKMKIKVK